MFIKFRVRFVKDAVLGVDHLETRGPSADLPVKAHALATRQTRLLCPGEIEKTQSQCSRAVRDTSQNHPSPPIRDLGQLNFGLHDRALSER